jgi:cysteine-rich repeat protein
MSNRYLTGRPVSRAALSFGPWLLLATACPSDSTSATESGGDTDASSTSTTNTAGPEPTTTTTTTGDLPTTDASETSSTTAPPPAVCGDGIVHELEICDDGNDDPDDGCNSKCERTGAVLWTYTHSGAADEADSVRAVAVDATGRIILAGYEGVALGDLDMLLIALSPDGKELWKRTYPNMPGLDNIFESVVTDDQGNIYVGGYEETADDVFSAVVRKLDPEGDELWSYVEPSPMMDFASARGLLLANGALYSTGSQELLDDGAQLVARRHDPKSGEAAWVTTTQADSFIAGGRAVVKPDQHLRVAGFVLDDKYLSRPLIVTLDEAGTLLATDVEDHPGGTWYGAAVIGGAGDVVLAGRRRPDGVTGYDIALRRIGPDGAPQWTMTLDHHFLSGTAYGVAVGPDEKIFTAGNFMAPAQFSDAFGGLYAGDGTPIWTHAYNNDDIDLYDDGLAAAFGPDFVVLAGHSNVYSEGINVWVRAFKAE